MSRNSKGLIKFHVFTELCRQASGRYLCIRSALKMLLACVHLPGASSVYTCMLPKPRAGAHVYVLHRCTYMPSRLTWQGCVTPRTPRHCDSVEAKL